jgi:threonine aldolase
VSDTHPPRGFASDNAATVHPRVLEAIAAVNHGHAFGYGHDPYSGGVEELFRRHFGPDARAFPVFNGSGANVVAIRAACRPYEAVICTDTAHINTDEAGAPEAVAGIKLLAVPHTDGKLTPETLVAQLARVGDEHAVQPALVSVSQVTELGTLYRPDELAAIADAAHGHGLRFHVDGARLSNAAAALDTGLADACRGADLISFGATKNGALGAEAVVVLDPALAGSMLYLRKQSLQLASKHRFLAAQLDALLGPDELWRANAGHANDMARRLAAAVRGIVGVALTREPEANAVFARLPEAARATLHAQFDFYDWDAAAGEVRWMCAWDTTLEDVDAFAVAVAAALEG